VRNKLNELTGGVAGLAFSYIGRHRHSRSPHLGDQAKLFLSGKSRGYLLAHLYQRNPLLPDQQIFVIASLYFVTHHSSLFLTSPYFSSAGKWPVTV
jgi:hypothetical protein